MSMAGRALKFVEVYLHFLFFYLGASSAGSMVANPKLSVIEIEAMLREKVRARCNDLQQVGLKLANL